MATESYLVFSQRIDSTLENFRARNRKKCFAGTAGLSHRGAFKKGNLGHIADSFSFFEMVERVVLNAFANERGFAAEHRQLRLLWPSS